MKSANWRFVSIVKSLSSVQDIDSNSRFELVFMRGFVFSKGENCLISVESHLRLSLK